MKRLQLDRVRRGGLRSKVALEGGVGRVGQRGVGINENLSINYNYSGEVEMATRRVGLKISTRRTGTRSE